MIATRMPLTCEGFLNFNLKFIAVLLLLLAIAVVSGKQTQVPAKGTLMAQSENDSPTRGVLGAVVAVGEAETEMQFLARVDTGARTCSLHTIEKKVIDGSKFMEDNVGKLLRFRIENHHGVSKWVERIIAEVRRIRTSEGEETRYLVPMALTCNNVEREVLVSLNDRSQMSYPMLLGRNFLAGTFVVDVSGAEDDPELMVNGL